MKIISKWLSIIFLTVLTISCDNSEQRIKKEKKLEINQKKEQLIIKNKNEIKIISNKNNAVMGWDTLYYYTCTLQEMFIDANKLICFEGEIKDITKSDSNYTLKVYNNNWQSVQNYIALITVNPKIFFEMKKLLNSNNHLNEGCFVFEVTKIFTENPSIKSNIELEGEYSYSYLDYDFDETLLIFKGNLIDFYLNEIHNE